MFDLVILGGGYSGTMLALHLARRLGAGTSMAVVDPQPRWGEGLAYSTRCEGHKINVPADRMGVSAEPADRFDVWLKTHHPELLGNCESEQSYVARHWFGAFVRERFADTLERTKAQVRHVRATAIHARPTDHGIEIITDRGASIHARLAAIAMSHGLPVTPNGISAEARAAPNFIGDPWYQERLAQIGADDEVLIVGTGLTMADVAVSLLQNGHRGRITAISRHGLLARKNGPSAAPPDLDFAAWPAASLSTYVKLIRAEIGRIEEKGQSWRCIFTALREQSEHIWSKLSLEDRQRFLRHLKCFYDAHRYRMAPETAELIEAARQKGQIEIFAARLRAGSPGPHGFSVTLTRRGASKSERRCFSVIVNCTGPKQNLRADPSHFIGALIANGLATPDPLGLGLAVDSDFRLIGLSSPIYALGPLTRERFGDTVGAPEILGQAQRLAAILAHEFGQRKASRQFLAGTSISQPPSLVNEWSRG